MVAAAVARRVCSSSNKHPTSGARECATGHTVRHREITRLRRIDLAMLANAALMHRAIKQHDIFVVGFAGAALAEGIKGNPHGRRLNKPVVPPPRRVHLGFQQRFVVLHAAKNAMHECFTLLKAIAGTPCQNDDVGLMQRDRDGRIVEFANLVRQTFKIIRLDVGELIDNNQAAYPFQFEQAFFENHLL